MCPIGMFAPVDRRETPQAQAKVKMQGSKVRTLGAKVRVSINVNVTTIASQYRSSNNMEDKIAYIYTVYCVVVYIYINKGVSTRSSNKLNQ